MPATGSAFSHHAYVRWGDLDGNAHMSNKAYLALCGDVRMQYFGAHGFPVDQFAAQRVGPVVRRDEIDYFRELHMHDPIEITLELVGVAPDGSRMIVRNRFLRADGALAATVTSHVGWLDLDKRKLRVPPTALHAALQAMPRADDFRDLESSIKR